MQEKPIYNPLNLPLGWDGKPIPYWLYKASASTPTLELPFATAKPISHVV